MKILGSRILLAGLLLLALVATLMMRPAQSFLIAQRSAPPSPQQYDASFQGGWGGTYSASGYGQTLLYINAAGELFGSLASNDGRIFAQISGQQQNDQFHLVFTAPPGAGDQNGHPPSEPTEIDEAAKWDNPNQFTVSGEGVSHPYSYTFKRLQQN